MWREGGREGVAFVPFSADRWPQRRKRRARPEFVVTDRYAGAIEM